MQGRGICHYQRLRVKRIHTARSCFAISLCVNMFSFRLVLGCFFCNSIRNFWRERIEWLKKKWREDEKKILKTTWINRTNRLPKKIAIVRDIFYLWISRRVKSVRERKSTNVWARESLLQKHPFIAGKIPGPFLNRNGFILFISRYAFFRSLFVVNCRVVVLQWFETNIT